MGGNGCLSRLFDKRRCHIPAPRRIASQHSSKDPDAEERLSEVMQVA